MMKMSGRSGRAKSLKTTCRKNISIGTSKGARLVRGGCATAKRSAHGSGSGRIFVGNSGRRFLGRRTGHALSVDGSDHVVVLPIVSHLVVHTTRAGDGGDANSFAVSNRRVRLSSGCRGLAAIHAISHRGGFRFGWRSAGIPGKGDAVSTVSSECALAR